MAACACILLLLGTLGVVERWQPVHPSMLCVVEMARDVGFGAVVPRGSWTIRCTLGKLTSHVSKQHTVRSSNAAAAATCSTSRREHVKPYLPTFTILRGRR
ncbi:hypothetical protein PMIN02_005081 [Paraphaeosphaeria minitans]